VRRVFFASSLRKGINELDACISEISAVAGGDGQIVNQGGGGDGKTYTG